MLLFNHTFDIYCFQKKSSLFHIIRTILTITLSLCGTTSSHLFKSRLFQNGKVHFSLATTQSRRFGGNKIAFIPLTSTETKKLNKGTTRELKLLRENDDVAKRIVKKMVSSSTMTATTTSKTMNGQFVSPLDKHNKEVLKVPVPAFVATLVILPIWAVTVLPATVLYQVGRNIVKKIGLGHTKPVAPVIDSGYVVDPSQIIPHIDRKYDIIVLGATGFTGQLAVRHLLKQYSTDGKDIRWAIAGRNEAKLRSTLISICEECKIPSTKVLNDIDIIIVDTSIASTMPKLVQQTRCVVTTAGPYSFYGNSVIEFCSKFGTHYCDITGEFDWIRTMIDKWQSTAERTGAILVPFCGHDSVPWDISVSKMQDLLQEQCNDTLKSVTFWDIGVGGAPGGTLATAFSLIEGTAQVVPTFDIDPFLRVATDESSSTSSSMMKYTKSVNKCNDNNPLALNKSIFTTKWDDTKKLVFDGYGWTMPYIMAPVNYQIVRWSHAQKRQFGGSVKGPVDMSYRECALSPNFPTAFTLYAGLMIFGSLLFNPISAPLLKRYVLPKSGEGPDMESMETKHYLMVYGDGIGYNGNRVETIFYLPKDAGCLETSRMLVESAISLVKDPEHCKRTLKGGFFSPASALGANDRLLTRLISTGTEFTSRITPSTEQ